MSHIDRVNTKLSATNNASYTGKGEKEFRKLGVEINVELGKQENIKNLFVTLLVPEEVAVPQLRCLNKIFRL